MDRIAARNAGRIADPGAECNTRRVLRDRALSKWGVAGADYCEDRRGSRRGAKAGVLDRRILTVSLQDVSLTTKAQVHSVMYNFRRHAVDRRQGIPSRAPLV